MCCTILLKQWDDSPPGFGSWNSCFNASAELQAMTFRSCKTSSLSQVRLINSSQTHVLIRETYDFIIKDVVITAPETSPNTDGIHISSASNIVIRNSIIGSGIIFHAIFLDLFFFSYPFSVLSCNLYQIKLNQCPGGCEWNRWWLCFNWRSHY